MKMLSALVTHFRGIHWWLRTLCEVIHRSPVDACHNGGIMCRFVVYLLLSWTNCWTNGRFTGDLQAIYVPTGRRQAIIWTNAGILLIGPLETNFSEILNKIHIFWFKKIHLKMQSGKWCPSCLGVNMLTAWLGPYLSEEINHYGMDK